MEKAESRNRAAFIVVLIATLLLAAGVGLFSPAFAATSGDCGETTGTVFFEIDGDGVMTISGTGEIKQQAKAASYAWYADRTKVKKLVLEEGVTNAPNSAFNGMTNLKAVELPSTLASWGTNVFSSSSNIETIDVTAGGTFSSHGNILFGGNETRLILSAKNVSGKVELPQTLTIIDANGLDGRGDITELVLPDGLQTIGNYAFRNIKKPTELTIPATVTSIGTYAFYGMEGITQVKIPESITDLSNYAFANCKKLKKAELPSGLKTIGTYVFQNCAELDEIAIPTGVTSIGANAFAGMTSLEELALPDGLTTLGASAFSGCTALKSIVIPAGIKTLGTETSSSMFLNCESLKTVGLPDGLTTIGASSFKGCSALEAIDIPATVTTIGGMAFQQCTKLKEVTVPAGVTKLTGTFAGCTALEKVHLPDGLTTLAQGGTGATAVGPFTGCESLATISIPAGVASIPKDTFNGCTSLTSLGLMDGVTSIGQNAYMGCTSLEDITIPKTVIKVMGGAFENCTDLTRVRLAEGMTQFNTSNTSATTAFKNCSHLTDIYIPDSLEGFQPSTFEQAENIQRIHISENANFSVKDNVLYDKNYTKLIYIPASYSGKLVLPATVTETGSRVAGFTHALTEIVFPEGFTTVGESAFYYADGLRKVTLPSTLKTIGKSGFQATGLRSIEIPDSVTSVGSNAFTKCEKMQSASIGSGVTAIPQAMFFNCYKLSDLTISDNVKSIGNQAFSGTQVPEIAVPDGCTSVGATAFANNTNLNSVLLPATITSIPSTAFNGDTGLKYIYFKGTAEQWTALKCTPAYGTVITDYKGTNKDLEPAIIDQQPQDVTYEKGQEPQPVTVTVTPQGEEGEQYFYTWYKNKSGEAKGGTTVAAEAIDNGSSCMPATNKIGTEYYYCVIVRMVGGYTAERTISDVAKVTVKMQMDGSGSEQDPFIVATAADLQTIYDMVKEGNSLEGVYIKMTADIELPADWDPIGVLKEGETQTAQGKNVNPFSGIFDGDGHQITVPEGGRPLFGYVRNAMIRNLNIYGTKIEGTGLIDHYTRDYETGSSQSEFGSDAKYIATIENVILKKGTKTRESGLIGEHYKGCQDASSMNPVLIVSCKAEDGVEIGYNHDEDQIGTFAGRVCGTIINCESDADVYGVNCVGGIAGRQDVAMGILHVINSSFHGTVNAEGNFVGGILGSGYKDGSAPNAKCVEITNCHADGTVNGGDCVGGIFGGDDKVAQCWGNGIGYINNNLFTGTLHAAADANYVGGIVGYYCGLNKYTVFENNYFAATCGANRWIGGVRFIDTSAEHETESDVIYINTGKSVANCPAVAGCTWQQGLNRTDDPIGADADKLGASASEEALNNGEIQKALNEGKYSMRNWVAGEGGSPVISEDPVCFKLDLSGDFKKEYVLGEELETEKMILTATWTDGKTTNPAIDDPGVTIEGYDKNTRGVQRVAISYGSAKTECIVKVLKPNEGDQKITVKLALYGDAIHENGEKDIHTMKMETLQTWIESNEYEVDLNATVRDVLEQAIVGAYTLRGNDNYIAGITPKDGVELAEFTNGSNSGWMYTLNGVHSQNTVNEQYLEDGDEIVFHYTDDYLFEEDDLDVTAVKEVIAGIEALPDVGSVTAEDTEAIWATADALAELQDLAALVPSALKEKLDVLYATVTPQAAEQLQQQAVQDMQEADDAIIAAQESSDAADQAYKSGAKNAETLATVALNAARTASQKALKAEASAQKALAALQRVQELAEASGDNDAINTAKAAVEQAENALTAASNARDSAQSIEQAADSNVKKIEKEKQEAKDAAAKAAARIKAAKKMKVTNFKVKTKKKGKAVLSWKKTKNAKGYQVQYKVKGKSKNWKYMKKSVKVNKITAKKLKKARAYSFRVRAYDRVNGKEYYGKWTKAKTVRAK